MSGRFAMPTFGRQLSAPSSVLRHARTAAAAPAVRTAPTPSVAMEFLEAIWSRINTLESMESFKLSSSDLPDWADSRDAPHPGTRRRRVHSC